MISLKVARQLKESGLDWQPKLNDFFAIPDRGMDERVFVISELLATIEIIHHQAVVAFQGASEWALDDLETGDLVWIPREDQIRQRLEAALLEKGCTAFRLDSDQQGYCCSFVQGEKMTTINARQADEAYAFALLYLGR